MPCSLGRKEPLEPRVARFAAGGLDELNRLGEPHSIRYFGDWIPDVKAAYNLRLIGE
jgi:hypothetical protein